jgi:hypothetical protein
MKPFALVAVLTAFTSCTEAEQAPAPLPPPVEVTLNLIPPAGFAASALRIAVVAFQDGDQEWTKMEGADGIYKATVQGPSYGVAVGCLVDEGSRTISTVGAVYYRTTDESAIISDSSCFTPSRANEDYGMVTGTATGLTAGEAGFVEIGEGNGAGVGTDNRFSLFAIKRTYPMWGIIRAVADRTAPPLRVVRAADVDLSSTTPVAINFAQAKEFISKPVILPANVPPNVPVMVWSEVRNDEVAPLRLYGTTKQYSAVPAEMLHRGDVMCVTARATVNGTIAYEDCPRSAQPLQVEFPQMFSRMPSQSPRFPRTGSHLPQFPIRSEDTAFPFMEYEILAFTDSSANINTRLAMFISKHRLSEEVVYWSFPDLSGLPGYIATLEPQRGAEMSWRMTRTESNTLEVQAGRRALTAEIYGSLRE